MHVLKLLFVFVVGVSLVTLAATHKLLLSRDGEKEKLYRWFDSLSYDEVRTGQFVELSELPDVIYGRWEDRFAFLIRRKGSKFLARTINLNKTGMETSALIENSKRGCKPANF